MKKQRIGTEMLSRLLFISSSTEQSYHSILDAANSNSMFIGVSSGLSKPFLLNFDLLVNPHIFVVGMTGSGKTFLVKNLMLKLYGNLGAVVFLIDFTGEYKEFAEFIKAVPYKPEYFLQNSLNSVPQICYLSFENATETKKLEEGRKMLSELVELMRKRELSGMQRMFIIMDEAWKLLGSNSGLETIIREGRKYSTGIILASQLLDDIKLNALSNVATLFIFRTQNMDNIERLVINYEIPVEYIKKIQNLDVGSCIAIQIYKSGIRNVFQIKKILGVKIDPSIDIIFGGKMIELKQSTVENMITRISKRDPIELISKLRSKKSIDLHILISELMKLDADRLKIISYLRFLGINEKNIADSFALAMEVNIYELE